MKTFYILLNTYKKCWTLIDQCFWGVLAGVLFSIFDFGRTSVNFFCKKRNFLHFLLPLQCKPRKIKGFTCQRKQNSTQIFGNLFSFAIFRFDEITYANSVSGFSLQFCQFHINVKTHQPTTWFLYCRNNSLIAIDENHTKKITVWSLLRLDLSQVLRAFLVFINFCYLKNKLETARKVIYWFEEVECYGWNLKVWHPKKSKKVEFFFQNTYQKYSYRH